MVAMDDTEPSLTIIIPSFNGLRFLPTCLHSAVTECSRLPGSNQILVVDNGSTDGSPEYVQREYPAVQLLPLNSNKGFAEACDEGMRAAEGQ